MDIYISDAVSWIPDEDNSAPKLEFTDPLFKRRFSQITKMTVQVVHDLLENRKDLKDSKLFFTSFRGEIKREFTINKTLIEDKMVLPAAFSLSVFNAPIAAATIALNLTGGYTVAFPSESSLKNSLLTAIAPILCGDEEKIAFIYADEKIPEEYSEINTYPDQPFAFACVLSSRKNSRSILLEDKFLDLSPKDFLEVIT